MLVTRGLDPQVHLWRWIAGSSEVKRGNDMSECQRVVL